MLSTHQEELRALRDIKGVLGAFVVNESGAICLNDMPGVLSLNELSEVGPRLTRIIDALAAETPLDTFSIRFVEHRLSLRPLPEGAYLCVLSDAQTNLPALRMATTLASRKLRGLALAPLTSQASKSEATSEPVPVETSPKAAPNRLMYRGRPLA